MARSKSDKAFDERVAQYSEELRELLTDLYGEQDEQQNLEGDIHVEKIWIGE